MSEPRLRSNENGRSDYVEPSKAEVQTMSHPRIGPCVGSLCLLAVWLSEASQAHFTTKDKINIETVYEGKTARHALRNTCGAWLAMTGAHPKVVQQVMRHSSITLTMDTYGHLFPGQEADAVARMRDMLSPEPPAALAATGTDAVVPEQQETAQRPGRSAPGAKRHSTMRTPATKMCHKKGRGDRNARDSSRYEIQR